MSREKACGAVVYRELKGEIEFLAVKSKENGDWGFPKGHVEEGESEKVTAKREVLEETGLNIDLAEGFREKIEYPLGKNRTKEVIYFIGTAPGQQVKIQIEEIEEFRWLTYSDMIDLLTHENNKNILIKAKGYIEERLYSI